MYTIHILIYIHIYIYICIHTYIHTYIYTHTFIVVLQNFGAQALRHAPNLPTKTIPAKNR